MSMNKPKKKSHSPNSSLIMANEIQRDIDSFMAKPLAYGLKLWLDGMILATKNKYVYYVDALIQSSVLPFKTTPYITIGEYNEIDKGPYLEIIKQSPLTRTKMAGTKSAFNSFLVFLSDLTGGEFYCINKDDFKRFKRSNRQEKIADLLNDIINTVQKNIPTSMTIEQQESIIPIISPKNGKRGRPKLTDEERSQQSDQRVTSKISKITNLNEYFNWK